MEKEASSMRAKIYFITVYMYGILKEHIETK